MFLLGSTTLLATLPLPDPDTSDHPAIKIIAGLLALGAIAAGAVGTDRRWLVRLYVVYGILLVSALMAVTRPIEATPFFYLWPMLYSAYFFSRREVALDLLIMWATLGLGAVRMVGRPDEAGPVHGRRRIGDADDRGRDALGRARHRRDRPARQVGRHRLSHGTAQSTRV